VKGYPDRPPGFQDHEDIQDSVHAGRRQRVADGGQASVPWRLSRSVIDSVGLAGAEFARNAKYALPAGSELATGEEYSPILAPSLHRLSLGPGQRTEQSVRGLAGPWRRYGVRAAATLRATLRLLPQRASLPLQATGFWLAGTRLSIKARCPLVHNSLSERPLVCRTPGAYVPLSARWARQQVPAIARSCASGASQDVQVRAGRRLRAPLERPRPRRSAQ